MNEQLLHDDVQARIDALDITRSFIVQAPAGSGKTELLIQRYLKLLAIVEYPEEILAITFTRKAAAEMQLRVLDALRRKREGAQPQEAHERLTYELAGRALEQSARLDWNLIGNPRRMRILTLDALNASITRAQPMSSPESASGARIVVGAELITVHRSAALATLDWLAESGDMRAATREVLQHVDNSTWLYVSYLAQMLATRDQWLPFVGAGMLSAKNAVTLRGKFEESLDYAVNEHLQRTVGAFDRGNFIEITEFLEYAADNMRESGATSNPICDLAGLTSLPAPTPDCTRQWLGLAELLLTQKGTFRKMVDKRQGFPVGDKARKDAMHALLSAMATDDELAASLHGVRALPPVRYSDEQWNILLALFQLLPLAVTELKRLFGEQGIADHVDVALNASAALGTAENPGDVALLLDYQVKHLLVDEMQDTSSAQYRMLEALTGGWEPGDGRTLYCVGDPMQSIYRFRSAEVGQFLLARKAGIGHVHLEPLLLRRNFRSGEVLVNWFNKVFPSILAPQDDALRAAVSYSVAVPVPHLQGQGSCVVHPVFGTSDDEAAVGCSVIANVLAENPDDDMAVLVRGRTQLPQLLANLRASGVAYRAVEIDRLTDLPEIIDILALTRAAVHQGDRIAWLGLLRAPWIGLDWSDLHALVKNNSASTVWELLHDDERLASLSGVGRSAIAAASPMLAKLVAPRRAQSLRDLIERNWIKLGGPGALNDDYAIENVYRFLDVLGTLEHAGSLIDVGELESILDLERVSTNDNARLQVMTMHRAKGLQFDHVLLYGLGRKTGRGDRRVLSWFDLPSDDGVERKIISPVGPRSEVDNDPVHRYIALVEAEKDAHEQARLLYVACTRARKSLHLIGNTAIAADGESIKPARSDSLLHLLWPAVEDDFTVAFEKLGRVPVSDDAAVWAAPVLRRFTSPWKLPDVKLLPGVAREEDRTEADTEVEFYWVGTEARIAGTLVHRWLQLLANRRANGKADKPPDLRGVTLRWLREFGLGEKPALPICMRVEKAVTGMLDDAKGRWILDGDGHAELELTGHFEEQLVRVVLDRVRIDEDGVHWIIDYKTSAHEGGNLQGFLQVEAERYQPQLARYAAIYGQWAETSVRCALYFPLLTSFVEIEV